MNGVTHALEKELADEELLHRHQLHPIAIDALNASGGMGSPRAHLLRSPSVNAVAVATSAAVANASEEDDVEDETSARLTHHEGMLKASILDKVQSEKRLRRLSSVGEKEPMNGKRRREGSSAMDHLCAYSMANVFVCCGCCWRGYKELEDLFEKLPEPYGQLSSYQRIQITTAPDDIDHESKEVCEMIRKCIVLRKKWVSVNEVSDGI